MIDPKFPIGPFSRQETYTSDEISQLIDTIANTPAQYRSLVENLTEDELARQYREGSWTIRQLVHHVADIQWLHFFRMKKALTEEGYEATLINMDAWADTADATAPVAPSLLMLEGTTERYVTLARSLTDEQLAITYFHPLRKITFTQAQALAISAWHLTHHLAHIRLALEELP